MTDCSVTVEVSIGELIDKITILEIKAERLSDPAKLLNVEVELELLREARRNKVPDHGILPGLMHELKQVNAALWDIEDQIRECERRGDFGPTFVALARSVYRSNDKRAELKRKINEALGSRLIEEKSYSAY